MKAHGHSTPKTRAKTDGKHARVQALGDIANYTAEIENIETRRSDAIHVAIRLGANSNQLAHACKTTPAKMKRDYPNCVKRRKE